jgi:hypothetical protein
MNTRTDIEATVIATILGIALIAIALLILHVRNPQIEAQCLAKGGQVLSTPGRISSCLYSPK